MSKRVYKRFEFVPSEIKVVIDTPQFNVQSDEESDEDGKELIEGKTIDQLKKEADEFIASFEDQKMQMIAEAERKSGTIIERAKEEAFELIEKKNLDAQKIRLKAESEAQEILEKAKSEADKIKIEADGVAKKIVDESYKKGLERGYKDGYEKESQEVSRLVGRVQMILNSAIEKRNEIFVETEQQVIDLVLLIAKKVIKVISENQKNVVINNVIQALRKLKSRGEVIIRVNTEDVELTSQHKKDFVEMVEGVKSIKILEDSNVDRGGCIIETDFGSIDARISSQLHEIQEAILELAPIQTRGNQGTAI